MLLKLWNSPLRDMRIAYTWHTYLKRTVNLTLFKIQLYLGTELIPLQYISSSQSMVFDPGWNLEFIYFFYSLRPRRIIHSLHRHHEFKSRHQFYFYLWESIKTLDFQHNSTNNIKLVICGLMIQNYFLQSERKSNHSFFADWRRDR